MQAFRILNAATYLVTILAISLQSKKRAVNFLVTKVTARSRDAVLPMGRNACRSEPQHDSTADQDVVMVQSTACREDSEIRVAGNEVTHFCAETQ